jgi:hypothetical protein
MAAGGWDKVATGTYIRMEFRSSMLTAPIRLLLVASARFLEQRKVIAREVMHSVGDAPFPPGRVGHGLDV